MVGTKRARKIRKKVVKRRRKIQKRVAKGLKKAFPIATQFAGKKLGGIRRIKRRKL